MSSNVPLDRRRRYGFGLMSVVGILLFVSTNVHAMGSASSGPDGGGGSGDLALLIAYVLLALVFSFLCSVAEAVLLTITPSFIAGLEGERPKLATLLRRLKIENVDQSLAGILTLNTIAHTVGAIGSGAKATAVFGSAWFGVFSAAMTLMILVLSEIVPKTVGAVYWRQLAGVVAQFVRVLVFVLYPIIKVSEALTRLISGGKNAHAFSRDEFIALAGIGAASGEIKNDESRILQNLFRLDALTAKDIMTPRTVVVALPVEMTVTAALEKEANTVFSRMPVYEKGLDNVVGFVLKSDLLLKQAKGEGAETLAELKREIVVVNEGMPISRLLAQFLDNKQHIGIVVGEFGETRGVVTLEDVVETLLGLEIVDESDKVTDMQALARQKWTKRVQALGLTPPSDM